MTKKKSTHRKPPGKEEKEIWKINTKKTARALNPWISALKSFI
jgi:hypothetical protein